MRLSILRGGSILRVIVLGAVAMATVFWANMAFAQDYPVGGRHADDWYYCYSSTYNGTGGTHSSTWSTPPECDQILWTPDAGGGGGASSVLFQGSVSVDDNEAARIKGWVVPARGIQSFVVSCEAFVTYCNNGIGSFSANADGGNATGFTHSGNWNVGVSSVPSGQCGSWNLDVVSTRSTSTYDRWWSPDPFPGYTSSGITSYPFYQAEALTSNSNRSGSAGFSCQVTSWTSFTSWLTDPANPTPGSGWTPGPGDLVPSPTPSPTPPTSTWDINPWLPLTDTVAAPEFDFGDAGPETCYTVVPGYSYDWDSVTYGWDEVEFCTTEQDLTLSIFGVDIGTLLISGFLLGGVAVLVSVIKRA